MLQTLLSNIERGRVMCGGNYRVIRNLTSARDQTATWRPLIKPVFRHKKEPQAEQARGSLTCCLKLGLSGRGGWGVGGWGTASVGLTYDS